MEPLVVKGYLQDLMLENNVYSEGHPGLCDLGSRVGAAASVCADGQPAALSLSLVFRLQVSGPVYRGPITYHDLTLAGPARYSCSANKENLLNFSQPCKHPSPSITSLCSLPANLFAQRQLP